MADDPRVTVVIPAYNEGSNIVPVLDRLLESVNLPCEVLVVVDFAEDTTIPFIESYAGRAQPSVRAVINDYGRGPAWAIRYGINHATAQVVVVTMADGCDDPRQIDELTRLVERGVVVAAA
jgi:glycosyltransferase involved in cell wall biosynthesis